MTPKLARIAAFILSLFYEYLSLNFDDEILIATLAHVSVETKSCQLCFIGNCITNLELYFFRDKLSHI